MSDFTKIAATDNEGGGPCVNDVGPDESGHYTKMVHTGIQQGMMSSVAEVWLVLVQGLGMDYSEAAAVLRSWNEIGPLKGCFLVGSGVDSLQAQDQSGSRVLSHEAIAHHVPAATIISAHLFRCAPADVYRLREDKGGFEGCAQPKKIFLHHSSIPAFLKAFAVTVYFCFLACHTQGLNLLRAADKSKGWNLNYGRIIQLWRGSSDTIIQAPRVLEVLESIYQRPDYAQDDLLSNPEISGELHRCFSYVKMVVLKSIEADMFIPAISQTLEYYKYSTSANLPTQFMEAQLDYFGQYRRTSFSQQELQTGLLVEGIVVRDFAPCGQ
ncbi:6-phosphogluconate dehydrogenase [Cladorrhinum sp. PSN259]|nr:6-phosphogluconate dehydrogenase [Cladorrhinum sp. PSN259]